MRARHIQDSTMVRTHMTLFYYTLSYYYLNRRMKMVTITPQSLGNDGDEQDIYRTTLRHFASTDDPLFGADTDG